MDDLSAMFGNSGAPAPAPAPVDTTAGVVDAKDAKKAEREAEKEKAKSALNQVKSELKEQLKSNPEMAKAMGSLSDSVEIVKILAAGKANNIIKNRDGVLTEKGKVKLEAISANVGVVIKNVGTEPINYTTDVYTANEAGIFVGQPVQRTLAPGAEAPLTRKCLTLLGSSVPFNLRFKNGSIVSGHASRKQSMDEYLSSFYFKFDKELGISVNDDDVKEAVDTEQPDGTMKVRPEYLETFGYLNNPVEKPVRTAKKSDGTDLNTSEVMAAYLRQLLSERGEA